MIGHARPVFLGFSKGGKMVATAGGVAFALAPLAAALLPRVWLVVFAVFRYASAGVARHRARAAAALPRVRRARGPSSASPPSPRSPSSAAPAEHPPPARGHRAAVLAGRSAAGSTTMLAARRHPAWDVGQARIAAASLAVAVRARRSSPVLAATALAAPWCGTAATADRPATVTGRAIRVVYAYPSDGARPSRRARRADLGGRGRDQAWWRARTSSASRASTARRSRAARRRTSSSSGCRDRGARCRSPGRRFEPIATSSRRRRGRRSRSTSSTTTGRSTTEICGRVAGASTATGVAVVYLATCAGVPTAVVAAHELLHAFGALAVSGPPHALPGHARRTRATATADIIYPYAADRAALVARRSTSAATTTTRHAGAGSTSRTRVCCASSTRRCALALDDRGTGSGRERRARGSTARRRARPSGTGVSGVSLDALARRGTALRPLVGRACAGSDQLRRDARRPRSR